MAAESYCELQAKELSKVMETVCRITSSSSSSSLSDEMFKDLQLSISRHSLPAFMISVDPGSKEILKGGLASEHAMKNPALNHFSHHLKLFFEMSLSKALTKGMQTINLIRDAPFELNIMLGPSSIDKASLVKDCSSATPIKSEVILYGLTYHAFKESLLVFIGLVLLATILLIVEQTWYYLST